jgi:DNA-directed RNA polymerase subunit beta'
VDLGKQIDHLQTAMTETKSKQIRKKIAKRIKLLQGLQSSKSRPEWMILTVLPVIPPDLRPLVPLEGGRFATSDLNDLYRRVINRNNRLKNLLQLKTPEVIIRNEKRMLQEAVDALFDNGRHGRAVTGAGNRASNPSATCSRARADASARTCWASAWITPAARSSSSAPSSSSPVRFAQEDGARACSSRSSSAASRNWATSTPCGLGQEADRAPDHRGVGHPRRSDRGHPVLLNRAPTLHRLSVQAFEPQLIEGEAIRIHPLVCTAYNADFDGDQMAVHVPLSVEAQLEARLLMMAPNNIFSPSSGRPIITPTQDITLGCFYLTAEPRTPPPADPKQLKLFGSKTEVVFRLQRRRGHDPRAHSLANPDFGKKTEFGDANKKVIETTVGRVFFSEIWPDELGFPNKSVKKSELGDLIWKCYKICGHEKTVAMLDKLKELGFREATRAGVSIGIDDMIIPKEKDQEIDAAQKQIKEVEKQYRKGVITPGERYNKIIDIWTHCTDQIANVMLKTLDHNQGKKEYNPVSLMVDSGARGNRQQVRQLAGVRGLMAKPSGDIIEKPILSNFREGSRCSSTSSRRTAPARVWPTPRSRPPIRVT